MKTATASTKFTSTRWKVAGRCCDPGSDLTEAFHKKNCRSTSASSSSFTTPEDAEKHSSNPSSQHSSQNLPGTPNEPRSKQPFLELRVVHQLLTGQERTKMQVTCRANRVEK